MGSLLAESLILEVKLISAFEVATFIDVASKIYNDIIRKSEDCFSVEIRVVGIDYFKEPNPVVRNANTLR